MKHLIKIESVAHGVLGVRHAGRDQQYCEAGELVILKWQPDAKWGLQEAHYIDGDGNVTAIDLTRVKVDGVNVVAFVMPDKDITIGGTFKCFVIEDWTSGTDKIENITPILTDGIYKSQSSNSTVIKTNTASNVTKIEIQDVFDGDVFELKLLQNIPSSQYRNYFVFAETDTVAAVYTTEISNYVELIDETDYVYRVTAPTGTRKIFAACKKTDKSNVTVKKIVSKGTLDDVVVSKENFSRDLSDYIEERSLFAVNQKDEIFHVWDSIKKPIDFNGKTMTVFGDSIALGIASPGTTLITDCFVKLFCDYSGVTTLDNKARSGATIVHRTGSNNNICDRVVEYTGTTDIILISGGTNDWNLGSEIGEWGDTSNTTVYGAMKGICDFLSTNYPSAVVIFLTPIPYTKPASAYPNHIAELDAYRTAIYDVATYYGYNVVSGLGLGMPRKLLGWNNEMIDDNDGCHPTAAGHALMARSLCGKLL